MAASTYCIRHTPCAASGQRTQANFRSCRRTRRLTLDVPAEPYWLDLPRGVGVEIRPVTTAIMAAAQAAASRRLGVICAADPEFDPDMSHGLAFAFLVRALARHAVTAKEGVGDAAGQPLPLTPKAVGPTGKTGARHVFGAEDWVARDERARPRPARGPRATQGIPRMPRILPARRAGWKRRIRCRASGRRR